MTRPQSPENPHQLLENRLEELARQLKEIDLPDQELSVELKKAGVVPVNHISPEDRLVRQLNDVQEGFRAGDLSAGTVCYSAMQRYWENNGWLSGSKAGSNLATLGHDFGAAANIDIDELERNWNLANRTADYQKETVPELLEALAGGTPWAPQLATCAMAVLREMNFGLTAEEYERSVGSGEDEAVRYERLCKFAGWIVGDGTLISHTPGELLRARRYGWLRVSLEQKSGQYLDLLASGEEADFRQLKRELEEALPFRTQPLED